MDIKWLQDFVCLGRTLNFSRAAEERNITQPAFSRRIKSLENWLGVPLIRRSTYPVQLSEAGILFLPVAQETVNNLSDTRQSIRGTEFGRTAFQRIAVLHTISVNFLTKRVKELENELPNLRVRVFSDYLATCCQLFSDGTCDFLLCYRHKNGAPFFDEDLVARKDIGVEKLIPVAEANAAAEGGWDISSKDVKNIPYLSYDPASYLGTVVDQIIGTRQPPLVLRYMDAHAEALKRSAIDGSGVAWLSERVVADELASGKLVCVGGPEWQTDLTLSLFSSLDRLDKTGQLFWETL
ncbi:HTH-type transcriptional regulator YjiE [Roseovarius litorisediminis]|uniref:HTH-type transcriptional regulator YjiE n=1 Tax=Roseovarius litorisediminis TaxID=1312363 RepID=A0A1Y5TKS1_9RHOB|nr:LysR family transcriptional regulator [Roseovarius litorisediminis]SLN66363.1 HTH-type transcriptional regulator YjiE [Roseovarius litorisediminis]